MKIGGMEVPKTLLRRTGRKMKPSCAPEMLMFLAALKRHNFDDTKCAIEKQAVTECVKNLSAKKKTTNTLNFHLQRISKTL